MGLLLAGILASADILAVGGSGGDGGRDARGHGGGRDGRPSLVLVPATLRRWSRMCADEEVPRAEMLRGWVSTRWDLVRSRLSAEVARDDTHPSDGTDVLADAACPHVFDVRSPHGALELFGFARAELECPEAFLRAATTYGRHLLHERKLLDYDIMHEVIRAETGYRLARINKKRVDATVFEEFIDFQKALAGSLQGWPLWEYEFAHWRYHKRPTQADEYAQLYNTHRPPDFQHVECPAVPLAYRFWSNFPTCPPTRLRDLSRFTDAYVSGMTVDNWRAGYKAFLSEGYNSNTSLFDGGDPTYRLSKGAHSVFAGVFVQKFPTDMWCYQQVIHDLRPHYVVDLGSSQGGSAVWFAATLKLFENTGKVITVDLALDQAYWLSKRRAEDAARRLKLEDRIDWNYVAGGSKNSEVRKKVKRLCAKAPCMVVSDSDHDYEHTYFELEWYSKLVGVGQYLVVEDTNIYGWSGFLNINDPNVDGLKKGPMEAANDFEFNHMADFVRTDWCAKHYGLSQTPNGWFFRKAKQARGRS